MMSDIETKNETYIEGKTESPPKNVRPLFLAIILSIVFSLSVMFLMVTVIDLTNNLLENYIADPFYASDFQQARDQYNSMMGYLTPLGYLSFWLTIALIVVGVIIKRYKLSFLGSLTLYLPVFGYFSFAMTALFAGIGVFRVIWISVLDLAPNFLNLGGVFFPPMMIILLLLPILPIVGIVISLDPFLSSLLGERIIFLILELLLLYISIIGFFIFIFGVVTWLYGRFQGEEVVNFWIYQYSRHPQYLGIMIWNYGLFVSSIHSIVDIPPPTFPFLVLTLVIIGMAMNEENTMLKQPTKDYITWRDRTAFMVPLPHNIRSIINYPMRKVIKKDWPENNKEIIVVLLIYGILVVLGSVPFVIIYQIIYQY